MGTSQRDSNPSGCGAEETRKRFPAQHARREAPQRKRAAPAARDIPHRPPLNWKRSSKGDRFCLGTSQRDSNPSGCGAEETRSVFQRSTRGAERRSGCGRRSRTRTSLIAHHRIVRPPAMEAFPFSGPFHGIRTRKGAELRKREAFSSAAREGRRPEAEAGSEMDPWRIPVCKKCQI